MATIALGQKKHQLEGNNHRNCHGHSSHSLCMSTRTVHRIGNRPRTWTFDGRRTWTFDGRRTWTFDGRRRTGRFRRRRHRGNSKSATIMLTSNIGNCSLQTREERQDIAVTATVFNFADERRRIIARLETRQIQVREARQTGQAVRTVRYNTGDQRLKLIGAGRRDVWECLRQRGSEG